MKPAIDYAKYFIKNGFDSVNAVPNTKNGNMKINKLCVLAHMISIAEYGTPLFKDEILAFEHGCVIEAVRLAYRNFYHNLLEQCKNFYITLNKSEQEIIRLTINIFGALTAQELSEIQHQFLFWQNAYNNGIDNNGRHDKTKSRVIYEEIAKESDKIKLVIDTFRENKKLDNHSLIINGIKFFYNPSEITLTDDILAQLREIASCNKAKEEGAFSIYIDDGKLVVY